MPMHDANDSLLNQSSTPGDPSTSCRPTDQGHWALAQSAPQGVSPCQRLAVCPSLCHPCRTSGPGRSRRLRGVCSTNRDDHFFVRQCLAVAYPTRELQDCWCWPADQQCLAAGQPAANSLVPAATAFVAHKGLLQLVISVSHTQGGPFCDGPSVHGAPPCVFGACCSRLGLELMLIFSWSKCNKNFTQCCAEPQARMLPDQLQAS